MAKTKAPARTYWPVSCRWIAAGTLAVYSAIGCQKLYAAPAFEPSAAAPAARKYDIPGGSLREAALAFEREAGVSIAFADPGLADVQSPGVSGLFTLNRALDRLVEGSGLRWRFTAPTGIRLELIPVSSSVDVNVSVDQLSASMPKFAGSPDAAPQTIDTVNQQTMEEQNITTLRDTLRDVAGISLAAGEGGAQGDNLTIRGFTARNDLFIDGMRDFGSYYRDPFNLEEVEVLQGPASVDFGRGSTGGVVNQASKTPNLNRLISGSLNVGTDATRRLTADINQPIGHTTAFRLNVMGDEANVAGRDVAENRRFGVAPSLTLGLGTPTRLTVSYVQQNADDIPDYGIPWLFNGPAPVNRSNYYGFKNANFLRTYDDIGTLRAEHDFHSHFSLRNQTRYANYLRDAQITEAQIANSPTLSTPLNAISVNRNEISVNSVESFAGDQLDLTGKFAHDTPVTGVEADREISDPRRLAYTSVPTTSLLNPNPDQPFTGYSVAVSSLVHTTSNTAGAYVLNTWKPLRKWELATGLRFDRFNTHYTQAIAPTTAFNRLDELPTWRAALSYHPVQSATLYVAAGTSFNPSAESLSLSAANANLPPEKNRTEEVGAKWNDTARKLSLRAALFDTVKTNAREPDPTNPLLNVLAGDQRVRGLQVEASGRITKGWELRTSYAYLDGRVTSSEYYPAAIGARLANVPRHTFNAWNTWRLPHHWEAGGGANYVSSRTASSTVPNDPVTGLVKQVPGYWVFNAMMEHPLSEHVTLQANGYNLANRYYYDQIHPAHIVPGPGRSLLVGLRFKF